MKVVLLGMLLVSMFCTISLATPLPQPSNGATPVITLNPTQRILPSPTQTIAVLQVNTLTPSPLPSATTPPTPLIPDSGWELLQPGLERRQINLLENERLVELLYLLRIDPSYFSFNVAYQGQNPPTLAEWQAQTGALIVVNGGYYRREGERLIPTGLTIIDQQPLGSSYDSFAGMFTVDAEGPDLRWLAQTPYSSDEPLLAALQSFPLLVKPGGQLGFPAEFEDGRKARRTVLAQDQAGRIVLLVAGRGQLTLHQLSLYLSHSDLELDIAVNLDGGPSSGLLLAEPQEGVPAFSPLPIVITVHNKR